MAIKDTPKTAADILVEIHQVTAQEMIASREEEKAFNEYERLGNDRRVFTNQLRDLRYQLDQAIKREAENWQ